MADTTTTPPNQTEKGWPVLKQHISDNKTKVVQWAIRLLTMIFTFAYILPIFGNSYDAYFKVLMCCMATNILRLHQRLPRAQFTREFWESLLMEDSFHYLFYSFIFQYTAPVTLVVIPIFLFAMMQSASYSLVLLDCLGQNSWWGARFMISLVEFQTRNMLQLCAICEIVILPMTTILIFTGRVGLLTPFVYYQFLRLRLASRRNPYTRNVFYNISNTINSYAVDPSLPHICRRIITGIVEMMRRMVPTTNQ